MYPIRDMCIHLTIPQGHCESASETQWPQLQCEDEEQVTGSIFDGLHYCTADASSLFKYNSTDSTAATRKSEECQPVWSTATSNAALDLTSKSVYDV